MLLRVNNKVITLIQPAHKEMGGPLEAGGVFKLNAGDVITLTGAPLWLPRQTLHVQRSYLLWRVSDLNVSVA